MYPDGRINPTPAHFAKNAPVELHPPVSLRLLRQRNLDREGRAICRIVFAHGMGIQYIASVFCVAEDTVIQAIENKEVEDQEEPDNAENDYWYVSREFRELYPRSRHQETAGKTTDKVVKPKPKLPQQKLMDIGGKKNGNGSRSERTTPVAQGHAKVSVENPGRSSPEVPSQNPTCRHFRDLRPIEKSGPQPTKLDRQGRAICRIVYPHLGNYSKIAEIFGMSHGPVRRAVLNTYTPSDVVADDYEHAGEEWKRAYPPVKQGSGASKRQKSPELDAMPVNKRPKKLETSATKTAIKIFAVEMTPRVHKNMDAGAVAISSFLRNVGGFDLSQWQETFREKGLRNMGDLATLAGLNEDKLLKTLTKLFAGHNMAEVHILLLADALADLAKDVL